MIDVVLAWSGGKDSTLALAALRADPRYRVIALLTTVTREYDRISIHGVRRAVLEAQITAVGLPLLEVHHPGGCQQCRIPSRLRSGVKHRSGALARAAPHRLRGSLSH